MARNSSSLGEAVLDLRADDAPLERDIQNAHRKTGGLIAGIANVIQTGLGTALGLGIFGLVSKVTELGASVIGTGINFNAMMQSSRVAFTTIIGDANKADEVLTGLQKLSAETPFEFPELAQGGKNLLAFGVAADDIADTLRRIGDVASGVGAPLNDIAELYGKAKVQGRLFTNDIYQFQGRGIPILGELAKVLGVSEAKVSEMVTAGQVGFPQLEKAFQNLTNKGGKFSGMMAAQSKTFNGLLSTAKDTFGQISGKVMTPFFDLLTEGLAFLVNTTSTPEFNAWIDDLASGVEDFVDAGLVPFLRSAWEFLNTRVIPTADSLLNIIKLLATGDFSGGIFGLNEDDPFIAALLHARRIVEALFNALTTGDWEGAWDAIAEGAADVWEQILGYWGDPRELVIAKLVELRDGIVNWLRDHGPESWETLQTWSETFWGWLTDEQTGALGKLGGAANAFATRAGEIIGEYGPKAWNLAATWAGQIWDWLTADGGALDQLGPKMLELTTKMKEWVESETGKEQIRGVGRAIGGAIIDGLGQLFGSDTGKEMSRGAIQRFITTLLQVIKDLHDIIASVGATFAADLAGAIIEAITGKEISEKMREGLERALKAWMKGIFFGDISGGLIVPPPQLPPTVPSAFDTGGAQQVAFKQAVPLSLQVFIGNEEIQNATVKWVSQEVQNQFGEASALLNAA